MRYKMFLLAVSLVFAATSASASGIQLWSTGVCLGANSGAVGCTAGLLPFGVSDNNYVLTQRADGGATGVNNNLTESSSVYGYLADAVGASRWLAPNPISGTESTGTYTYRTTFSLAGFTASTLVLWLDVSADNGFQVLINGLALTPGLSNATSGCLTGGVAAGQCFSVFTSNHSITNSMVNGGWLAGLNTIDFVVTNSDSMSPTALRVQASGDAAVSGAAVPEPGTLGLLGLGLAGFGVFRRKTSAKK